MRAADLPAFIEVVAFSSRHGNAFHGHAYHSTLRTRPLRLVLAAKDFGNAIATSRAGPREM